jgi:hypothetical protein
MNMQVYTEEFSFNSATENHFGLSSNKNDHEDHQLFCFARRFVICLRQTY